MLRLGLVSLLPRDHFEYLVSKYEGNLYVKHYTYWNHFLVLLWSQLTGRESIRDIESSPKAHSDKLYRLGMGKGVFLSWRGDLSKKAKSPSILFFQFCCGMIIFHHLVALFVLIV